MKITILVLMAAILLTTVTAESAVSQFYLNIDDAFAVKSYGDRFRMLGDYAYDDTPYIYIRVAGNTHPTSTSYLTGSISTLWEVDSRTKFTEYSPVNQKAGSSVTIERWMTLSDWENRKDLSEGWVVSANFILQETWSGDIGSGFQIYSDGPHVSSFSYDLPPTPPPPVVPEPVSSALFLIGGATLGFRRLRKRE